MYTSAGNFRRPSCVSLIRWLGGIETPRLNVTRVPPRSSPEAWGHDSDHPNANASRHRPTVIVHAVGPQASLVPDYVWHCLGSRFVTPVGRPGRRISQR